MRLFYNDQEIGNSTIFTASLRCRMPPTNGNSDAKLKSKMETLLTFCPNSKDLLALQPEELAGILVEIIPPISQGAGFVIQTLTEQVFPREGGYPRGMNDEVVGVIAEALSWLQVEGIIIRNPTQHTDWYKLTRRGRNLKTRVDVEAFRKGRILPIDLLQEDLASKVHHLFLRGDHDTAVFQAFKEVEVAVRSAAKLPDNLIGRDLMMKAFHPETGPLRV